MNQIYISLGSNVYPEENVCRAAALLRKKWPTIQFSHCYRSAAREIVAQDDFVNAVAKFSSLESPESILDRLQEIESTLAKSPPYRFGPRTIDLDLLLYENIAFPSEDIWRCDQKNSVAEQLQHLYIPHIRMHKRAFVLAPLGELMDFSLHHPVFRVSWQEFFEQVRVQECIKIPDSL